MPEHAHLKEAARRFAAEQPAPAFYKDHGDAIRRADTWLESSPLASICLSQIRDDRRNLGHGVRHARTVTRDAIVIAELEMDRREDIPPERRQALLDAVAVAGLLHDVRRTEHRHAHAGARAAAEFLEKLPLSEDDGRRVVTAIRNHEAFKPTVEAEDGEGALVSDVLYDADKFRWGPDNFTDTLWFMIESGGGPTLERLHRRFLQSLDYIRRVKGTFRTATGERYGPEIIDQGLVIGKRLFRELSNMMGGPKMELITDMEQIEGCCTSRGVVTLGNFDGLHLGHQELIQKVVRRAGEIGGSSIVFTFHPHPLKVLSPDRCPPLISTYDEKVAMFEELGIDLLLMIPFTETFSKMSAEDFARDILKDTLNATEVFVGFNYRFGRRREGTVDRLRGYGEKFGFVVNELREVASDNEVISSTKIRHLLKAGDVAHAARLLGRPYAITGLVVTGDRRGRQLGFPTANLDPFHEIMPYPGVYAVRAHVEGHQYDGVVNAGFRPTFDKRDLCVEAHLFDFSGDIYGKEITVFFVEKIRDEKRFESLDELVAQIGKDVTRAKEILGRE